MYGLLPGDAFFGNEALTAYDLRGISDVLKQYTPLHAITRVYEGVTVSGDEYTAEEQNTDAGMCAIIKGQLQETNTVALQNNIVSSWIGTQGRGGLPKIVNNPLTPTTPI